MLMKVFGGHSLTSICWLHSVMVALRRDKMNKSRFDTAAREGISKWTVGVGWKSDRQTDR